MAPTILIVLPGGLPWGWWSSKQREPPFPHFQQSYHCHSHGAIVKCCPAPPNPHLQLPPCPNRKCQIEDIVPPIWSVVTLFWLSRGWFVRQSDVKRQEHVQSPKVLMHRESCEWHLLFCWQPSVQMRKHYPPCAISGEAGQLVLWASHEHILWILRHANGSYLSELFWLI